MSDVEIKFEREGVEGIVAVGTILADAARRFGIRFDDCKPLPGGHQCMLRVSSGAALLSPLSETEAEHFSTDGRRSNERLACEARIIKPGEIEIMTYQKKENPKKDETTKNSFQEEFDALPLDKKFASLLQMEVATLNDAFSYVANSSMKVIEKFGDAITDFGAKIETEVKKATDSAEAKPANKAPKAPTAKPKAGAKRKPAAPRVPRT